MTDPVIFGGISISLSDVKSFLPCSVRGPVRAGDLGDHVRGQAVVILDGELAGNSLIPPQEIRDAVKRGVRIYGGASVGAWRAADVTTMMIGCGWVYDAYRRDVLAGSEEIAVMYDPLTLCPLTVPLVNVRFSLEREVLRGSFSSTLASKAFQAVKEIQIEDRESETVSQTIECVTGRPNLPIFDIKSVDARRLLSRVRSIDCRGSQRQRLE